MHYLLSFLCGVFVAVGLPHFIKGITGQVHMTPFGRPSSAAVNVVWGSANFMVAGLMFYLAQPYAHLLRAAALIFIGMFIVAINLAHYFTIHSDYNQQK